MIFSTAADGSTNLFDRESPDKMKKGLILFRREITICRKVQFWIVEFLLFYNL